MRKSKCILLTSVIVMFLSGCATFQTFTLVKADGGQWIFDSAAFEEYADFLSEEGCLPLEQLLYAGGFELIEEITVATDSEEAVFFWADVADTTCVLENGTPQIDGVSYPGAVVSASEYVQWSHVSLSITDLAPTAAEALGLRLADSATGTPLAVPDAEHVLFLFLDGFGYLQYESALQDGLIPHLAALPAATPGLTTYPPITSVSSASLLTGSIPAIHGADRRGIRVTESETLLDRACADGLSVVAVEGNALAFNLRNAELMLSGDRDANGGTDDNVLANALSVLELGMPDIFFVHFHGIDDLGHTYGPGTVPVLEKISEVDQAVGEILDAVPPGTLVIIFADHGMHAVQEEGRLGNHGHLIPEDMLIPLIVFLT
ncbi:MAG: alkaline phosphatase family protein [Anaerolineales bacterium]|nr:alkaline phosphatase family protein [Anaerolineales bacterium]